MENRLKRLLKVHRNPERLEVAQDWKKAGGKVIGLVCSSVPEELVYAAGMLPWRVMGVRDGSTPLALAYRPQRTCLFATHVLESVLRGELDFLDGIVAANCDDDMRRLADVLIHKGKPSLVYLMHLPRLNSDAACRAMTDSLSGLAKALRKLGGEITDRALMEAIELSNRKRQLLRGINVLRKKEIPSLSGSEMLSIALAASTLPVTMFNRELETLEPYWKERKAPLKKLSPRLLLRSDKLDDPSYVSAIEGTGCLVAMDDTDAGSRYFMHTIEHDGQDMLGAIARSYLNRPPCPRAFSWDEQVGHLQKWVIEFNIDGILDLPQAYSYWQQCQAPYLRDHMAALGIPFLSFERMYHFTHVSQLQTRVQAFVEMLEQQRVL